MPIYLIKAIILAKTLTPNPSLPQKYMEMLPCYDKPTTQHVVEEAVASGIEDIIIVTARFEKSRESFRQALRT